MIDSQKFVLSGGCEAVEFPFRSPPPVLAKYSFTTGDLPAHRDDVGSFYRMNAHVAAASDKGRKYSVHSFPSTFSS